MCWLDAVILLPLIYGLVRGLMRGLVTELIAILAVVLGVVGTRIWGMQFAHWLLAQFTWPEAVCNVVAYTLLFLGIVIVCNILGKLISRLLKAIHLGWVNRLLGAFFGTVKWAIIVLALVFIVSSLDEQFHFIKPSLKEASLTYNPAVHAANDCVSKLGLEFRK